MAISRFQSSFKVRTDLMDNMTPNNVVQREVSTPAGEWKPAAWLPVVWQNEKSKDYFTISSGKVVSFDASGRVLILLQIQTLMILHLFLATIQMMLLRALLIFAQASSSLKLILEQ